HWSGDRYTRPRAPGVHRVVACVITASLTADEYGESASAGVHSSSRLPTPGDSRTVASRHAGGCACGPDAFSGGVDGAAGRAQEGAGLAGRTGHEGKATGHRQDGGGRFSNTQAGQTFSMISSP